MSYLHPLRDTVNYKGIEREYQIGSARDYDAWMDDDGGGSDFYGEMNSFGAVDKRKEAALERAKEEYERRQALDRRISENASGVLTNRGLIDELNAAPENNDVSPVPTDYTLSSKAQNAKDAVEQYEGGLERTGSQFLDNAKAQIKDAITSPTRGPGSLAELFVNPLFDNPDNPQLVLGDSPSSVTNTANVNNAVSTPIGTNIPGTFLNEYKLGIGDLLRPVNRESQVQNDKDQLKVASIGGY
tara:strand:- start:1305 stop:2033 length:729 start_codon:yes stop_codon:yes gene_type:complete